MLRRPLVAAAVGLSLAQPAAAQTTTPPPLVIQSVETRWTDVFCDLTEVSRPNPGEVMVRVRYRNLGKQPMRFPDLSNAMRLTALLDPVGRLVYGPLKDTSGAIVASTTITDINSGRSIPAGGSQAHWVKMTAPPDAVTTISVVAPGAAVFDDVAIGAKPTVKPMTSARQPIATQEAETEGVSVEVINARRTAAGVVTIVWRYRNAGTQRMSFPGLTNQVGKAYVIHPGSATKYPPVTTQDRDLLGGTTLVLGETGGASVRPGETLTTWAKFQAPPEDAKTFTFVVPGAAPFENVPLASARPASEEPALRMRIDDAEPRARR